MVYPGGPIPRVEPHDTHRAFIEAVRPQWAMINIRDARRLVKRDETADSYYGLETSVIVTTTISDDILDILRWEDELEIIREFEPAFHIPADYSTYDADTAAMREENITECMEGTIWMEQQLRNSGTQVIPLLKGTVPFERNICYRTFDHLDTDYAAYYVAQYFSGGQGVRIGQLETDLEEITDETDCGLLLIGLLSAAFLSRLPTAVVASAGLNGWRSAVEPRTQGPTEMLHRYSQFVEEIAAAIPGATANTGKAGMSKPNDSGGTSSKKE